MYILIEKDYRKITKHSNTWNVTVIILTFEQCGLTIE